MQEVPLTTAEKCQQSDCIRWAPNDICRCYGASIHGIHDFEVLQVVIFMAVRCDAAVDIQVVILFCPVPNQDRS